MFTHQYKVVLCFGRLTLYFYTNVADIQYFPILFIFTGTKHKREVFLSKSRIIYYGHNLKSSVLASGPACDT